MGAYLSEPVTEKCSSDETNDYIDVGASSMQGWRVSQEDAHNCILSYDENTSLFAVYDGHGGAEVATYCADKLPDFLKKLQAYKDGDFEQALKDAFLGFDATLLEDDVVTILKRLAGEKNPDECSEIEEEEEDLNELCEEGALPLDQVLEKYKGCVQKFPHLYKLKLNEASGSGSGTSKPMSPFLRGRQSDSGASTCNDSPTPSSSSTSKKSPQKTLTKRSLEVEPEADSMVSSSSGVSENLPSQSHHEGDGGGGDIDNDKANEPSNSITKNGTILKCNSPDSSSTAAGKKVPITKTEVCTPSTVQSKRVESVNGEVVGSSSSASPSSDHHQENEVSTNSPSKKEEVKGESASCSSSTSTASESSSRSAKQENGEVSSYSAEATKGSSIDKTRLDFGTSPGKISSSTNEEAKEARRTGDDEDDSSSDDDIDFQAEEENSSTEDGDADCESCDEEETEEEDEEPIDPESDDRYRNMMDMIDEPGKDSGCTAVVALINGRDLYVANAGDSRCVVCRNGKAVDMSIDHKPEDKEESKRIMEAGGNVTLDGRVNGGLNLSRALGDHAYKMNKDLPAEKQMISALPDIRKLAILPEDEFMILACDGIWNFMSSEEVVEFVKKRLDEGQQTMSKICEELFTNCLAPTTFGDGTGCDNMTAVLVRFKPTITSLQSKILFDSEAIPAVQSKKRSADESNDAKDAKVENISKRPKTESDSSEQVTTCGKSSENDTNGNDDVQMSSTTDSNSIHQNTTATTS